MVSKLSFKGDKPKKRKHKTSKSSDTRDSGDPTKKTKTDAPRQISELDERAWVSARYADEINGPVLIVLASNEIVKPPCICCDSQGKIYSTTDTDIPESIKLPSINNTQLTEPTSTQQVFIAEGTISEKERLQSTKIFEPDLPPKEREVSLKTAEGRYLTADPVKSGNGTLSGKATAISKPQYFKLIPQDLNKFERYTLWKIQTSWGQYIQLTPNEHKESRFDVRTVDRADEDGCNFVIRIHAKYQRDFDKLKKAAANDGKIIDEKYISSKVLRERAKRDLTKEEIKTLKHAYAEGRLNEALLDLRQKSKTDTMC